MKDKKEFFDVFIENAVKDRDSKKRTMTVIVSNEDVNRYGHVVRVNGWDYKNYINNNPVVLINHGSNEMPVAKATKVWKSNRKGKKNLMATIEFTPEGISPRADLAFALYDNGFMTSVSPGYMVDYEKAIRGDGKKDPIITFNGQELIEISLATIPANTEAVKQNTMIQECLDLGIIDEDLIDRFIQHVDKKSNEDNINDMDKNAEQSINYDIEDFLDSDTQEECILESEDKLYGHLFDVLIEEHNNNDIGHVAVKLIEEFENQKDSNQSSDQSFDNWLHDIINK